MYRIYSIVFYFISTKKSILNAKSTVKISGIDEFLCKVKKIREDSLDSIPPPSPSVKIQIMGGKDVKAKHYWIL